MKDERIIKEAWLTAGSVQGKGSDLYEALVAGKYITRRTTAVRARKYKSKTKYLIKVMNASNKVVFSTLVSEFEMNNTMMEEF